VPTLVPYDHHFNPINYLHPHAAAQVQMQQIQAQQVLQGQQIQQQPTTVVAMQQPPHVQQQQMMMPMQPQMYWMPQQLQPQQQVMLQPTPQVIVQPQALQQAQLLQPQYTLIPDSHVAHAQQPTTILVEETTHNDVLIPIDVHV
jgi:hypothetical protein